MSNQIHIPSSVQRDVSLLGIANLLFIVFVFGFSIVFLGFKINVGINVSPFDIVMISSAPILALIISYVRPITLPSGFFFFSLFVAIHTALAFKLGAANLARELVQTTELMLIIFIISQYTPIADWPRLRRLLLLGFSAIAIFCAAWHIANGHLVGWKLLGDPKSIFLFLPVLVLSPYILQRRPMLTKYYLVLGLLALIVLASGERKALIAFLLSLGVLSIYRYLDIGGVAAGIVFALALGGGLILTNEYAWRQFQSLTGLANERTITMSELAAGYVPDDSVSNAQRLFVFQVSSRLISQNLVSGLGTNGYREYLRKTFDKLPVHLRNEIHNEFLRVLVENGLVGFIPYLLIWFRAIWYYVKRIFVLPPPLAVIYLMLMASFISYCAFEGSGNETFVIGILVALLPDIFARLAREHSQFA